jgi:hypothetical protein
MTGDKAFLSSEIPSSRLCKSTERVPKASFQTAPLKEITSRQKGRTGWPRNVTRNVHIFGKVSTANAVWTIAPQIHVLLNDAHSGTYSELSFSSVSGLPEYYVPQNDE